MLDWQKTVRDYGTDRDLLAGLKRDVAQIKPTLKREVPRRRLNTRRQLSANCDLADVLTVQNLALCDNGNNNNDNNNDNNDNNNDNNDNNNNDNNNDNVSNFTAPCGCRSMRPDSLKAGPHTFP